MPLAAAVPVVDTAENLGRDIVLLPRRMPVLPAWLGRVHVVSPAVLW